MEKSRPRFAYPEVIDRPELKSPLRTYTETAITTLLWMLWIYFIIPILTFILWIVGIKYITEALIGTSGMTEMLEIMQSGGKVILAVFFLNILWIWHNKRIFNRVKGRRRTALICSDEEIAQRFNIDLELLKKVKESSRVEVSLKNDQYQFFHSALPTRTSSSSLRPTAPNHSPES